ncbi:hypothetical protein A2917_01435 [Candidatus Nomurabacteria bacterium RIFCSPLOWO2_01_FULL_42_17]|uniref:Uncharacterized protein n=1 Tax=Candidatus Nomurabacteria bacterium RIFCSPLOWO2_01_FULL_42_17 TaxID=1801780 RepID=A0A1F6XLM4_9BACT|nr:MAG: hypothetical protein A2917_01435 [Candidatus Nomurabacteria bacterium RIFCSPLOWO2_01_FULL_42_17]
MWGASDEQSGDYNPPKRAWCITCQNVVKIVQVDLDPLLNPNGRTDCFKCAHCGEIRGLMVGREGRPVGWGW